MSKLVVGNWKMNKTVQEANTFCKEFLKLVPKKANNFCLCVPFTCLNEVTKQIAKKGFVGVQNIYPENCGAFTGEINADMVIASGAKYCIVGHSERRKILNESNEFVNKKVKYATNSGLKVILCVGETIEEKSKVVSVLKNQLKNLNGTNFENLIIAYEPIWAIGTGKVATNKDIYKAHKIIIDYLKEEYGEVVPCLYGGSVNPENAEEIFGIENVAGVLVGGASLDALKFAKLVKFGL